MNEISMLDTNNHACCWSMSVANQLKAQWATDQGFCWIVKRGRWSTIKTNWPHRSEQPTTKTVGKFERDQTISRKLRRKEKKLRVLKITCFSEKDAVEFKSIKPMWSPTSNLMNWCQWIRWTHCHANKKVNENCVAMTFRLWNIVKHVFHEPG
jgi:hypothetical protein